MPREREASTGFKYRKSSDDTVRRQATQQGGNYDSYIDREAKFFKPKDGDNAVRIMPRTWEDTETWGDHYGIEVWLHADVGTDHNSYLCLNKMKGKACPLCEAQAKLQKAGDADAASDLKPRKRILVWVIDRENESEGPKVWSMSWSFDKDIAARCINKKTDEIIHIDHPDEGYDVEFSRSGSGLKTRYNAVEVSRDETPLSDRPKVQAKWLDYIEEHPLPDLLVYHEPEYILGVFEGAVAKDDEDEEEEDDRPVRNRRRRDEEDEDDEEEDNAKGRSRKAPSKEDDEDEEEEDEDEKPSKGGSRGKAAPKDEDEDDDEDEDSKSSGRSRKGAKPKDEDEEEEDEDEAPAKGKSRKPPKDEEDEEEEEEDPKPSGRSRKAAPKDEDEDEEEEDEDDEPVNTAKRSIDRMKNRRGKK